MAGVASPPTTSFDDIELHKENIQPLASGRSARALAQVLSARASPVVLRGELAVKQAEFEKELNTASELDDPFEVWVRYVNWTVETFPAGNSHDSGLLHLLERATREFLHEEQYKNDPRYLKLWIQYIQNHSDAPREAFAYIARHNIGQRLALFYEEFATLLESIGRKNQAAEIYQMGIENNARPVERLVRKFDEFKQRLVHNPPAEDEPSSPALRAVRPALATKPLGGALGGPEDQQQQPQPQPAPAKKPARQKMAVFSDADAGSSAKAPSTSKETAGWEEIGTREHRSKENAIESKPFAGQTLKQEGGKKSSSGGKLMVFRDTVSILPCNMYSFSSLIIIYLMFCASRTNTTAPFRFVLSVLTAPTTTEIHWSYNNYTRQTSRTRGRKFKFIIP